MKSTKKAKKTVKKIKSAIKKTAKKAPAGAAKRVAKIKAQPSKLGRKIKGLAKQTQNQIYTQTEALKSKLSAYGIGVDDMKARAKLLEQVLKDLRTRDFLKQPGVQNLVERVTRKNVEKANHEAQKMASKVPRKKLSNKQKEKQERQFLALSERSAQELGQSVVQAIIKRVEEVRRNFSGKTESLRRKSK